MDKLRCSIIIPVFNGHESLVRAAIDSVEGCLGEGFELLVVDSGSAQPVSKDWLPATARAKLVSFGDNLGLFANWNRAMQLAKGEFIWALCADDRLNPEVFNSCVAKIEADPHLVLVSTSGQIQTTNDENLGMIGNSFAPGIYDGKAAAKILLEFYGNTGINPFNYPSGILMRRSAFETVGRFDESTRHIGDIDLYFRLLNVGNLYISADVGCIVTRHEAQNGKSLGQRPTGMLELQKMIKKLDYLTLDEKRRESSRLHGLSLLAVLSFVWQRDFRSAWTYFKFALNNQPVVALKRLGRIIIWKIFIKFSVGHQYWQSRLDQTRVSKSGFLS